MDSIMKLNKLFHWLYFSVMMLPIFILPIFALAVRSDNNFTPIEVQEDIDKVVDFNQLIDSNFSYFQTSGTLTFTHSNDSITYSGTATTLSYCHFGLSQDLIAGHKLVIRTYNDLGQYVRFGIMTSGYVYGDSTSILNGNSALITVPNDNYNKMILYTSNVSTEGTTILPNLFDLTQMFGEGNEPTLEEFNNYFTDNYYPYTLSQQLVIENYDTVIYNDTDIGSQMVYTMYQSVNKYFNFDNVFNFGDLYSWLQLNFFNGTAPMGFFIFWHLLIYWLLTSLLWLLFDVLIYVPMLVHKWLDKASIS